MLTAGLPPYMDKLAGEYMWYLGVLFPRALVPGESKLTRRAWPCRCGIPILEYQFEAKSWGLNFWDGSFVNWLLVSYWVCVVDTFLLPPNTVDFLRPRRTGEKASSGKALRLWKDPVDLSSLSNDCLVAPNCMLGKFKGLTSTFVFLLKCSGTFSYCLEPC